MDKSDLSFFEEDVDSALPTSDQLQTLAALAEKQLQAEAEIKRIKEELAEKKKELFVLSSEQIPSLMEQCGVSGITSFTLGDGSRITIKRVVKASIPKARRQEAFAWLRGNDGAAIVKNTVSVSFGKGEDDKAARLEKLLRESASGYNVEHDETVHAQTLAAFVRERLERGEDVPTDLLGVFEYKETKIVRPKS